MKLLLILLLLPLGISASHRPTKANSKQWPPDASLRLSDSHHTHMPTKAKPVEVREEKKEETDPQVNEYVATDLPSEPMVRVGCMDVPLRVITAQALEQEKSNK